MAEKAAKIAALEMARQQLHSARSSELGATPRDRPLTPQEQKQAAVVDAQLASVEEKLRLEKQALEVLETQKRRCARAPAACTWAVWMPWRLQPALLPALPVRAAAGTRRRSAS